MDVEAPAQLSSSFQNPHLPSFQISLVHYLHLSARIDYVANCAQSMVTSSCLRRLTSFLLRDAVRHQDSACHSDALLSWHSNSGRMLPGTPPPPTIWPQSCSSEITSRVLLRSFPTCFRRIRRGSAVLARAELAVFLQQSVVRHFKWKLICDLHGQRGENELMKHCKWNIRQGAVREQRTEMVILWNLNSRLAELGDILHLSVFCVNCNVNGNFMGLKQNENGVIALCLKCGIVSYSTAAPFISHSTWMWVITWLVQ